MLLQQAVEFRPVAFSQTCRIGDIAIGQFEQLNKVVALEPLLGFSIIQGIHGRYAQGTLD